MVFHLHLYHSAVDWSQLLGMEGRLAQFRTLKSLAMISLKKALLVFGQTKTSCPANKIVDNGLMNILACGANMQMILDIIIPVTGM